jgi:hypothetical protein
MIARAHRTVTAAFKNLNSSKLYFSTFIITNLDNKGSNIFLVLLEVVKTNHSIVFALSIFGL